MQSRTFSPLNLLVCLPFSCLRFMKALLEKSCLIDCHGHIMCNPFWDQRYLIKCLEYKHCFLDLLLKTKNMLFIISCPLFTSLLTEQLQHFGDSKHPSFSWSLITYSKKLIWRKNIHNPQSKYYFIKLKMNIIFYQDGTLLPHATIC